MKKTDRKEKAVPFRLPTPWLEMLQDLKIHTGIPKQQLLEDATAFYLGKSDPLIIARRKMFLEAFASGDVARPFSGHALLSVEGLPL